MNFSIENKKSGKMADSFSVIFSKEELKKNIDKQVAEITPKVKLDGFRVGKVPAHIVKKNFSSEIRNKFVEGSLGDVLKSYKESSGKQIHSLVKVILRKFDENEGAVIDCAVDFNPIFELKNLDDLCKKINLIDFQLKDEDKEAVLDILIESLKDFENDSKKNEVKKGDLVDFFYECYEGDKLLDSLGDRFIYGDDEEFYFDLNQHLKDVKVGDKKTLEIDFPKNFEYDSSFAGKKILFKLEIKGIFSPIKVDKDEKLAKKFGFPSYEEFYLNVLDIYKRARKQNIDMYNSRLILDALSKEHDFSVPPSMYMSEFKNVTNFFHGNLTSDFTNSNGDLLNLCKRIAKRRVKLRFIIDKICEDFNLTVEKKDLETYISENIDSIKDVNKSIRDESFIRRALESIRESKCIKLIFEKAKDTMKVVDYKFVEKDLRKNLTKDNVDDDVSDFDEVLKIFSDTTEDSDDK